MSSKREIQQAQKEIVSDVLAQNEKVLALKVQDALEGSKEYQSLLKEEKDIRAEQHNNNLNISKKSGALKSRQKMVEDLKAALTEHERRKAAIAQRHEEILASMEKFKESITANLRQELLNATAAMIAQQASSNGSPTHAAA